MQDERLRSTISRHGLLAAIEKRENLRPHFRKIIFRSRSITRRKRLLATNLRHVLASLQISMEEIEQIVDEARIPRRCFRSNVTEQLELTAKPSISESIENLRGDAS